MEKITEDIYVIKVSPIMTNCYVVKTGGRRAIIIDPGDDYDKIIDCLASLDVDLDAVLVTHAHYDHMGAAKRISENFNCSIYLGKKDVELLAYFYDWSVYLNDKCQAFEDYIEINNNDVLVFGNKEFSCLHTPGHSPGSISFKLDDYLFSGDVVFAGGGYGRTDLGGSYPDIVKTLSELMSFADQTVFLPGHGEVTSVLKEKVFYEQ